MATDNESFNRDLYDLLKVRGYQPVPLDSKNQRVPASQAADVIQFTFTKDGEEYGKAWVSIDDAANVIVYYDEEQQESPSTTTPGAEYDDSWTGFLKHLKSWAQRRQLSFELSNKDRLGDDMRQRDYFKMKERVSEGYYPMGKKASYNDAVPSVKIILQHNRALEEGEQRYRNVAKIFLENQEGERFLAPTNRPGIARVYARHIAEGGVPNDDRWNHIKSICEDYNKMAGFVRATRNGQFNESATQMVQEGVNHYNNLRETLHKMTGHRGYQAYFESWTPSLMEDESDDSINELFVQETMDPRIESAMPILSRLKKPVTEMSEVDTLAEWADSIISEKLDLDEGDVVPFKQKIEANHDEMNYSKDPKNRYYVIDHTMNKLVLTTNDEEEAKREAAEWAEHDDLETAVMDSTTGKQVIYFDGYSDAVEYLEGGDDDWIPDVEEFEQEEENRNRKRGPANDVNEMDKSPEANPYSGQGHRKGDDNASRGPDKTAKMMAAKDAVKMARKTLDKAFKGDVEENFIGMAPQAVAEEEEVEESGLQAYLGKKKYGEKGMKALQQAGRDGASKEKMASIRAKHDKLDESETLRLKNINLEAPRFKMWNSSKGPIPFSATLEQDGRPVGQVEIMVDADASPDAWNQEDVNINSIKVISNGKEIDPNTIDIPHKQIKAELLDVIGDPSEWGPDNSPPRRNDYLYDLEEDLDANQKRVGQLGPTEKVKNNNIGKLVGANESTEIDPELARIIEMARFKR